ncbi:cytochrome P450 [Flagelloscypha sp. PMI_526]|nr:cytochrome P450 [Flagelloscypha sp. PMI_526]
MPTVSFIGAGAISAAAFLAYSLASWYLSRRRRFQITTPLKGPQRLHPIWGWTLALLKADNVDNIYEEWIEEFGSVVGVPAMLWNQKIILSDPKAVTHFYANDVEIYDQGGLKKELNNSFATQSTNPAFSLAAIRRVIDIFYDSAHKTKAQWEANIDSKRGTAIIEVQEGMNRISLDGIGAAGFGHHFNSIEGQDSAVGNLFRETGKLDLTIADSLDLLPNIPFPRILTKIPTPLNRLMETSRNALSDIAEKLMSRTKQETKSFGEHSATEKSIIGLLIKAESAAGPLSMTNEEVVSQMNVLLMAGYETTSISLTWALIELAKNQDIQNELRDELNQFSSDPTGEQLMSATTLPFLDGVVHETLRLHPPFTENNRVAMQDDVLPLSRPYITADGVTVDRLTIAKGSNISIPITVLNRSKELWGEDAKEFNPRRWLPSSSSSPSEHLSELVGHRHMLTFIDGPRLCLGKHFALTEMKATLFVLVKHFAFELENGVSGTEIGIHRGILKRPKVVGQNGAEVPMRVKRI